jgi:hypothetical protein
VVVPMSDETTVAVRFKAPDGTVGIVHFARIERLRYRGRVYHFERDSMGCPYLLRRDGELRKRQPVDDERHWFWSAYTHWLRKRRAARGRR